MRENERKTILAIDDDITILTSIRSILSGKYEVSLAKSADMAWTILNNNRIDLILLDVEMPDTTGLEFMAILKKLTAYYYIPVIFVTSHATPEVIRRAKEAGADAFVVKPFAARTLLIKIESVFESLGEKADERDILIRLLHLLDDACKKGLSVEIERLIDELAKIHIGLQMDGLIVEISKHAHQLDYKEAIAATARALELLSK
jgi:putative two-component system response regulator